MSFSRATFLMGHFSAFLWLITIIRIGPSVSCCLCVSDSDFHQVNGHHAASSIPYLHITPPVLTKFALTL